MPDGLKDYLTLCFVVFGCIFWCISTYGSPTSPNIRNHQPQTRHTDLRYTQEVLASELNINRSVLSRIEAGTYPCSIDVLAQISVFFNVTVDYLVFGTTHDQSSAQLKDEITNLIRHLEHFKESNVRN